MSTCFCQWQNKLKMLKFSSLKINVLSLLKKKKKKPRESEQIFLDTQLGFHHVTYSLYDMQ